MSDFTRTRDPAPTSRRAEAVRRRRAHADELERRIEAHLPASERDLPRKLDDAKSDGLLQEHEDWEDRFVDGLARHFPGLAPAIRAVAARLAASCGRTSVDDPHADPCGLLRRLPPVHYRDGCTGIPSAYDPAEDDGPEADAEGAKAS